MSLFKAFFWLWWPLPSVWRFIDLCSWKQRWLNVNGDKAAHTAAIGNCNFFLWKDLVCCFKLWLWTAQQNTHLNTNQMIPVKPIYRTLACGNDGGIFQKAFKGGPASSESHPGGPGGDGWIMCLTLNISCARFGQAVQGAAGPADGAAEVAERTQAGRGRVRQSETGAAGSAAERGQSRHGCRAWESMLPFTHPTSHPPPLSHQTPHLESPCGLSFFSFWSPPCCLTVFFCGRHCRRSGALCSAPSWRSARRDCSGWPSTWRTSGRSSTKLNKVTGHPACTSSPLTLIFCTACLPRVS